MTHLEPPSTTDTPARPYVLACGALVRELRTVLADNGLADAVDVEYLPAPLHNRPERIVPAIEDKLATIDERRPVFLGYADCGTGGLLDAYIDGSPRSIERLPGAHCYEFFTGADRFAGLHDDEPGTLYLTDYLARHFDALIWRGLGLDRHPVLRDLYFANYQRVLLLAQTDDPELREFATAAAERLGLPLEVEHTGLTPFSDAVTIAVRQEGV